MKSTRLESEVQDSNLRHEIIALLLVTHVFYVCYTDFTIAEHRVPDLIPVLGSQPILCSLMMCLCVLVF